VSYSTDMILRAGQSEASHV